MAETYLIANVAVATTTIAASVATGTSLKTMLQVKLAETGQMRAKVIEWGVSFNGSAAAVPIPCELCTDTGGSGAVTAHAATGIVNLDPNADAPTDDNPFALSVTETGFTSTNEGSFAGGRMLDVQLVAPTNQYVKQFPLGREPMFSDADHLRIRVHAAADVNCFCYVIVEV